MPSIKSTAMRIYTWIKKDEVKALEKDRWFWQQLSEKAYPVTKGVMRLPISLEPFVFTKKEFSTLEKDSVTFLRAAKKIAAAYYIDQEIQKVLSIDPAEIELIDGSKHADFTGVIRLDLFCDTNGNAQVVEINADYPDGFFMHDVTAQTLLETMPVNETAATNNCGAFERKDHANLFSQLLESKQIPKNSHIFIGYDKERSFIDEFHLAKIKLTEKGWNNISVGPIEDIEFKKDNGIAAFYFNDKKIDVLRRGTELSKIRKVDGLIPYLLEAERAGLIVINNFRMRLLGYKSLLAALCDARFQKYLDPTELAAVKKLLPETHKLDNPALSKNALVAKKDLWVLKPIDLTEGAHVYVGSSMNQTDWEQALIKACENPSKWIAQQKVAIPEANFNLIENNHEKIITVTRKYDCNPHFILHNNTVEIGTTLVRFSESTVLNVAKGGGITYAFSEK
ncbi:MAG: hypothetical protein RIT04_500 [Candidatus Parcubacteria bacterium]|jgi:uncharacterized circularly permuted ATP-grasp superfamily protein